MRATTKLSLVLAGLAFAVAAPASAFAQDQAQPAQPQDKTDTAKTPPQKEEAPGTDGGSTVTVTGKKNGNKIDRQVYDVGKDPSNQNASVADTLKKVPGVDVDSNGDVTLRGKHVLIYVNGRPSQLLSGDNRGLALKAMPSKVISKIEVISNPGAQYGSEGSGGIINLVTNVALPPGHFGNESLKVDSAGGYQPGIFEAVTTDKLTLMGFFGFNRSEIANRSSQALEQFDTNGQPASFNLSNVAISGHAITPIMFSSMEYKLGKDDVLNGQATLYKGDFSSSLTGGAVSSSPTMTPTSDMDMGGGVGSRFENESLSLSWMHYGKRPDETLKVSADLSNNVNINDALNDLYFRTSGTPGLAGTTQRTSSNGTSKAKKAVLSVDLNTPVGDDQLSSGLQMTHDDNEQASSMFGPGAPGSVLSLNPNLSQLFRWRQTLYAAYVTYQKEIGDKWTILGGLRSETLVLNTHQVISGETNRINYTKITPSVFATYVLSSDEKLRFNYSQRLERPAPYDLGSRLVYQDLNNVFKGNASLKPQITNGFELSDEYARGNLTRSVRLFVKQDTQLISTTNSIIADPQNLGNVVVQTTRVNQGMANTAGVDVYFSNTVSPALKMDADIIASKSVMRTLSWPGGRSIQSLGGKIGVNYTAKNKDQLRVDLALTGKAMTPQGYTGSHAAAGFQFTHNINSQVQIAFGGSDLFRTDRKKTVVQTPLVYSDSEAVERAPVYYVTITRNFFSFPQPKH
ncbi:TonB-dependent receptor [Asticcacaulis solisilvae]|uniref:TonB-dependent receptor n=1 Tax=Asticcacaulis solisilvae TaxID=1217274 RepID=UPI003FD75033